MIRKRTPAQMRRLVIRWRASGESGARFARRHQVSPWTFWYWCRKLAGESPSGATREPTPPAFVPVHVAAADGHAPLVEIVFTGGERLSVRGASAELVRTLLAVLRSAC
jgi:transposase-like protein